MLGITESSELWRWVVTGGGATLIATVVGSAIAFFVQRWEANRSYKRETQRPFLEEQFKLYREAVAIVSRLTVASQQEPLTAILKRDEELAKAETRFWELYWGSLGMVEDSHVETAMVLVGRCLRANLNEPDDKCAKQLNVAALNLAHSVRKSLEKSWGVSLDVDGDLADRIQENTKALGEACSKP